jgi:preprotein translocase subunit Sss1
MNWLERFKHLREDWERIMSVAEKPDSHDFVRLLEITLLFLGIVGLIAFIVQFTFAVLLRI